MSPKADESPEPLFTPAKQFRRFVSPFATQSLHICVRLRKGTMSLMFAAEMTRQIAEESQRTPDRNISATVSTVISDTSDFFYSRQTIPSKQPNNPPAQFAPSTSFRRCQSSAATPSNSHSVSLTIFHSESSDSFYPTLRYADTHSRYSCRFVSIRGFPSPAFKRPLLLISLIG